MNTRLRLARLLLLLVAFSLFPAAALAQQTYYLSPDGSDQNAGTEDAPWATLAKASQEAAAGDTVVLQPGTYEGALDPANSGTAEAPIVFRAAERHAALLTGGHNGNFAVDLTERAYIRVYGLHIRPDPVNGGRWMNIREASHITVDHMLMEHSVNSGGGAGKVPFNIVESDHVRLLNSTLREKLDGDMMHIFSSHHLLLEGNAISHTGHSPMAISPRPRLINQSDHIVVRGNAFHNGWGRDFELFGDPKVLFENNVIVHGYHSRFSAGPEAKLMLEDGIVRFNRVFRNWGSALNMGYYAKEADGRNSYFYNNVFDDNYDRAMRIETVNGYVFKNNIFSRNDPYGGGRQLVFGSNRSSFTFARNDFWAGEDTTAMIDAESGELLTLKTVSSEDWRSADSDRSDNVFRDDNLNTRPEYVAPKRYNHALQEDSPLRNAGQVLTTATGSGGGTELPVEDAGYFYDGFDIEGEEGDLIAIGSDQQQARVTNVDRDSNTLTLDREVSWSAGDPVGLPWAGEAPDIGIYEHGAEGRPSVQITTEPFVATSGEEVTLQAVVRGDAEPAEYHWRIGDGRTGDGRTARGASVTRSFEDPGRPTYSPGGYPVYCRVTMEDGSSHLGAGYVEVQKSNRREKPLAYLSFDGNPLEGGNAGINDKDAQWWYFWYFSRPNPDVEMSLEFEDDGNGVLHFAAPEAGHGMGVRAWPGQWNIDTYPEIRFRYRIDEGLPLGLYLQAFDNGDEERRRYLALAPKANLSSVETVNDPKTLEDDGNWHQITLDAGQLQEAFPDVNVLEKIRFEAVNPYEVEEGDSFWLDDFYIVPEGYEMRTEGQEDTQLKLGQTYPSFARDDDPKRGTERRSTTDGL